MTEPVVDKPEIPRENGNWSGRRSKEDSRARAFTGSHSGATHFRFEVVR
jgi:hypothetical protein